MLVLSKHKGETQGACRGYICLDHIRVQLTGKSLTGPAKDTRDLFLIGKSSKNCSSVIVINFPRKLYLIKHIADSSD